MFTGKLKIVVIEAKDLQLTGRMSQQRNSVLTVNPYVTIDADKVAIERTSTKSKTDHPTWNETFNTEFLRNIKELGFTIFHDATMPPDDFLAMCTVPISKLAECEEGTWVSRIF